ILRCLEAPDSAVRGEVFNAGDDDDLTWRSFYQFFATQLGLDLSRTPVRKPYSGAGTHRSLLGLPRRFFGAFKTVVTSGEFRSLGRRVLATDPLGTFPAWMLDRFPGLNRGVRRLVKADSSLPVYRPTGGAATGVTVQMGSAGARLTIDK